ncbi:MAG: hypothetical protein ACOC39_02105, partial [Desulfovermiculus sp.]
YDAGAPGITPTKRAAISVLIACLIARILCVGTALKDVEQGRIIIRPLVPERIQYPTPTAVTPMERVSYELCL